MGGTKSKEEKNKYLQEIGARAMKKNPFTFLICTKINLTNDVIVTKSPSDPNENYKKLNLIGEGNLSQIYRVRNEITDAIKAMKIIKKSELEEDNEKEIINEINVLRKMDHPNILKIFEFYSNKDYYAMILELCSNPRTMFRWRFIQGDHTKRALQRGLFIICHVPNFFCNKLLS